MSTDERAFLHAQSARARQLLTAIDLDGLSDDDRVRVDLALRALSAPAPDETFAPSADVGVRAQRAAEEHLAACAEAEFAFEEGRDDVPSPAVGPYSGCETCLVREVLAAAWPIFEAEAWISHVTAGAPA